MGGRVLVAYATKYGATAEIAEKIGQVLRQAGLDADVLPADRVGNAASYRAVVLGSGAYMGQWRKEAARFLKANEKVLAERPVWLFSSGPTDEGDPIEATEGWRLPRGLRPVAARIRPRDITLFHGAIELEKLSWFDKWIIKKVKAPVGDLRDWNAITSWATVIADELKKDK